MLFRSRRRAGMDEQRHVELARLLVDREPVLLLVGGAGAAARDVDVEHGADGAEVGGRALHLGDRSLDVVERQRGDEAELALGVLDALGHRVVEGLGLGDGEVGGLVVDLGERRLRDDLHVVAALPREAREHLLEVPRELQFQWYQLITQN